MAQLNILAKRAANTLTDVGPASAIVARQYHETIAAWHICDGSNRCLCLVGMHFMKQNRRMRSIQLI
jgi:hypothetical protein